MVCHPLAILITSLALAGPNPGWFCKRPVNAAAPQPASQGTDDAQRDIAAGVIRIKLTGSPGQPPDELFRRMLRERYGIPHERAGDWNSPQELLSNVAAYNQRMRVEIERRHGKGVIEATMAEAQVLFEIESLKDRRAVERTAGELARRDVARGQLRFLRIGAALGIDAVVDELMERDLQAPTLVLRDRRNDAMAFVDSYNEFVRKAIRRKVGAERYDTVVEEAVITAAERDIAAGLLIIMQFGGPPDHVDLRYEKLLKDRYGIVLGGGGCILPTDYDVAPYNRRMHQEIEERFGAGVLDKTREEAERLVRERRGG